MRPRSVRGSPPFAFSLVDVAGLALGTVVYERGDWLPGELIAPGALRVVAVVDPTAGGPLPLLVVERVEGPASSA